MVAGCGKWSPFERPPDGGGPADVPYVRLRFGELDNSLTTAYELFRRGPTDARTAWRGSVSNPGSIRSVADPRYRRLLREIGLAPDAQ